MAYPIKLSAFILILFLSQIWVLSSTDKTPDSTIHIFLSFRGPDTRDSFTSLMNNELFRAGFNVFMDEKSIRNGKDIDPSIKEAIKKSMGAVIIFSKEFASSEWCLDELVLIIEQRKLRSDYILVPIYMEGVKPDDIGEQGGSYGEALAKHKKRYWFWNNKVKMWRAALRKVEGYKGKILTGKWDMFFNEIVEETRQEFSLLGITVNPRSETSRRDPEDGLPTFVKLLNGLGILGNFIDQNPSQFPVISPSSIQQHHHQSVQNKKSVELEKGLGSVWGWGSAAAFTICFSLLIFIGCWKRSSNKERKSIEDPADPPRMPETVIGTSTTSERHNSAMARPSNSPTRMRPEEEDKSYYSFSPDDAGPESSIIDLTSEAPEESLVAGTSEVLNSPMVSPDKASTWIQPKPDPSCGIQKCKNLSRTSAFLLERNDEKEELGSKCSFSPDDDDASLESSITGGTVNVLTFSKPLLGK